MLAVASHCAAALVDELATTRNLVEQLLPVITRVCHKVLVAAKLVVTHSALLGHLDWFLSGLLFLVFLMFIEKKERILICVLCLNTRHKFTLVNGG